MNKYEMVNYLRANGGYKFYITAPHFQGAGFVVTAENRGNITYSAHNDNLPKAQAAALEGLVDLLQNTTAPVQAQAINQSYAGSAVSGGGYSGGSTAKPNGAYRVSTPYIKGPAGDQQNTALKAAGFRFWSKTKSNGDNAWYGDEISSLPSALANLATPVGGMVASNGVIANTPAPSGYSEEDDIPF